MFIFYVFRWGKNLLLELQEKQELKLVCVNVCLGISEDV